MISFSEILVHTFSRVPSGSMGRLVPRAALFLSAIPAAGSVLGAERSVGSGLSAAELWSEGATVIGILFVNCYVMFLLLRSSLHYKWFYTAKFSTVHLDLFSEMVLFSFIQPETSLCLIPDSFRCLFRHQTSKILHQKLVFIREVWWKRFLWRP